MKTNRLEKLIGLLIVFIIISNFIPTGYQIISPGIAADLSTIIQVEEAYENHQGAFFLTSVSSENASLWNIIQHSIFRPAGHRLTPITEQLPPDMDMERFIELMTRLMEESKYQAQALAFDRAGYDHSVTGEGALIEEVLTDGTAYGELKTGDIIKEIDGQEVEFANDAAEIIRAREIGETVFLQVLRDGQLQEFELETVELAGNPEHASIGVYIKTYNFNYQFPLEVVFNTEGIIGPSAGSMFVLEIYNQLTTEDITAGRKIAGTGSVSSDGKVNKIDGVKQKIIAAEKIGANVFILPEENFQQISATEQELELVPVENIDDIFSFLEKSLG